MRTSQRQSALESAAGLSPEKRILHVVNDATTGGAQTLIEALASHRAPRTRVDLVVLMRQGPLSGRYDRAFDSVRYLGITTRSRNLVVAVAKLSLILNSLKPTIIHSHLLQSDFVSLLSYKGGAKHFSTLHTSGMTYEDPYLSRVIGRAVGSGSRRMAGVILCSPACDRFAHAMGFRNIVATIPNGVVVPPQYHYAGTSQQFLSLARWHPMKGHKHLFPAFLKGTAKLPSASLVCAGSGMEVANAELAGVLDGLRTQWGAAVDKIVLMGPLADVLPVMAASCVLVSSSTYGEASPMVGLEACANGLPVISTDVGSAGRSVIDGRFLVSPSKVDELARAIQLFTELRHEERLNLSDGSRRLAAAEFNIGATVEAYDRIYERLSLVGGMRDGQ